MADSLSLVSGFRMSDFELSPSIFTDDIASPELGGSMFPTPEIHAGLYPCSPIRISPPDSSFAHTPPTLTPLQSPFLFSTPSPVSPTSPLGSAFSPVSDRHRLSPDPSWSAVHTPSTQDSSPEVSPSRESFLSCSPRPQGIRKSSPRSSPANGKSKKKSKAKSKSKRKSVSPREPAVKVFVDATDVANEEFQPEDQLLLQCRVVERLVWKDIQVRFQQENRNVNIAALQMRYTRLKAKLGDWTGREDELFPQALEEVHKNYWNCVSAKMSELGGGKVAGLLCQIKAMEMRGEYVEVPTIQPMPNDVYAADEPAEDDDGDDGEWNPKFSA